MENEKIILKEKEQLIAAIKGKESAEVIREHINDLYARRATSTTNLVSGSAETPIQNAVSEQAKTVWTALMYAIKLHDNLDSISVINSLMLVVANKPAINLQSKNGTTALMLAVIKQDLGLVERLITSGSNLNLRNKDGNTALMIASKLGYSQIADKLASYVSNFDMKNKDDETALMLAAKNGHYEIVNMLLSSGADVFTQNNAGETALDLAKSKNYHTVCNIIANFMSNITVLSSQSSDYSSLKSLDESSVLSGFYDEWLPKKYLDTLPIDNSDSGSFFIGSTESDTPLTSMESQYSDKSIDNSSQTDSYTFTESTLTQTDDGLQREVSTSNIKNGHLALPVHNEDPDLSSIFDGSVQSEITHQTAPDWTSSIDEGEKPATLFENSRGSLVFQEDAIRTDVSQQSLNPLVTPSVSKEDIAKQTPILIANSENSDEAPIVSKEDTTEQTPILTPKSEILTRAERISEGSIAKQPIANTTNTQEPLKVNQKAEDTIIPATSNEAYLSHPSTQNILTKKAVGSIEQNRTDAKASVNNNSDIKQKNIKSTLKDAPCPKWLKILKNAKNDFTNYITNNYKDSKQIILIKSLYKLPLFSIKAGIAFIFSFIFRTLPFNDSIMLRNFWSGKKLCKNDRIKHLPLLAIADGAKFGRCKNLAELNYLLGSKRMNLITHLGVHSKPNPTPNLTTKSGRAVMHETAIPKV